MPKRNEKTARNRAIVEAWLNKTAVWRIARMYRLSEARVNDIIATYKLRAIREARKTQ